MILDKQYCSNCRHYTKPWPGNLKHCEVCLRDYMEDFYK